MNNKHEHKNATKKTTNASVLKEIAEQRDARVARVTAEKPALMLRRGTQHFLPGDERETVADLLADALGAGEDGNAVTFTDGFLTSLAHDLEILFLAVHGDKEGHLDNADIGGQLWRLSMRVRATRDLISRLHVANREVAA